MIEIGVIDDDRMFLDLMPPWIAGTGDIALTTTAPSVEDFLAQAPLPDIVLLDLNLNNYTVPADNVARLVAAGLKVIVVSIIPDADYIASTTEAGATTYVTKTNRVETLATVIRAVHRGEEATTREHAFWLYHDDRPNRPQLSPREKEVLIAYGTGTTMDAIARQLNITKSTVQTHLNRVKAKYAEAGRPILHRGHYSDRIREDRLGRERLGPPSP